MPYEHDNQSHLLIIVSAALAVYAYVFGHGNLAVLLAAVGAFIAVEPAAERLVVKTVRAIKDGDLTVWPRTR